VSTRTNPATSHSRPILLGIAIGLGVVAAAALVAASQLAGGGGSTQSRRQVPGNAAASLLARIPQRGNELGAVDAPVTLVEYADLQCPYCAQYAADVLPELIRAYVRPGDVKLVFRGLAFIGPDSTTALRAVVAAGNQNRLWDVLHLLYASQRAENSGWVTSDLVRDVAGRVRPFDAGRMSKDTATDAVTRTIAGFARAATADGVRSTPSFTVGRSGGELEPLAVSALDPAAFAPTLDGLLGR
jgi:protein-disulfide isomerase